MVNQRNGFTFVANVTVLSAALIIFSVVDNGVDQFRYLMGMVLCLGSCTSLFFMLTIKEPSLTLKANKLEREYKVITMGEEALAIEDAAKIKENVGGKTAGDWLKEGTFYVHGLVYMVVRIAVNVTMTMMPFYLQNSIKFKSTTGSPTPPELAAVPLCQYVFSLIFSIYLQAPMTRCLRNRMYPMLVSIVIIAATSFPLLYVPSEEDSGLSNLVYPLIAFQGIGLAIMLNTATSLISDVIGSDAESSAFVYGVYSLLDKFSNGFILSYFIAEYSDDDHALRVIMAYAPIICAVASYILTFIGQKYFSHKMAKITGIKAKN